MLCIGNTMRIMAGTAGGSLIDDVKTVATVLADRVNGFETLVAENAIAIMTFVAKRVGIQIF